MSEDGTVWFHDGQTTGSKAREKDLLEILQLTYILAKVEQSNLQSMSVDRMVTH